MNLKAFLILSKLSSPCFSFQSATSTILKHATRCLPLAFQRSSTSSSSSVVLDPPSSYTDLVDKLRTIAQLRQASAVLDYDRMTVMPQAKDTSDLRGAQLSTLAAVIHEKSTDNSIPLLIDKSLQESNNLSTDQIQLLKLTKRSFEKNYKISAELEKRRTELASLAYSAWVQARKDSDFPSFVLILKDCFDTAMEVAKAHRGEECNPSDDSKSTSSLYTEMLDEYEMGMSAERIDDIFSEIETALVPLIQKVLESKTQPKTDALRGTFPIEKQKEVNRKIVTALGFDINYGRMDESVHPFTMALGPYDVRITSRYSNNEWYQGLAASIHEGGHAIYEQNLGKSGLEIDSFLSMGTHESQSLFWERHVGMSREFCQWITPTLKEAFSIDGTSFYSPDEIYAAINAVSPGPIRVEADELTYPLHVILRYNIERDVIDGKLSVADIAKAWKSQMKSMLNLDIEDDAQGCLQDIHWSGLAIGYFPTYLIGSATAAQLAYYCEQDIPTFRKDIEHGDFSKIKDWLHEKVHKHGRRYSSLDALLKDQVGEELNPNYLIEYLTKKYSQLYQF